MDLIKLSIKRPSVLIVMLLLLLLGGFYSYKLLNYELIPKFEVNVVTISTVYAGASPSEIESTVTKKVEDAVSALENIKKIPAYFNLHASFFCRNSKNIRCDCSSFCTKFFLTFRALLF